MYAAPRHGRWGAALAAAALVALLGWALLAGLAGGAARARVDQGLALFRVTPPPPRPERRAIAQRAASPRRSGRAAPANIRSRATQVAAPRPIVVVPLPPPPITVALKPFAGNAPTQGATERVGPGTGAGGVGDGTGSGGWGDGDGGGGGADTPPVWKRGRLTDADYPPDVGEAGFQGTVTVKFLVWTDGRVRDCEVLRSSGNATLDATTCRLIQRRFRYEPSRDPDRRAVPAWLLENHEWVIEPEPAARRDGPSTARDGGGG
ncbi:energy transducer TonB [Sphingomonas sp. BK235]|uniref:energy transducer TonB n=1 Tax=Sphingomonas sp. BK235 TaxID=2512131 RepID=UPI001048A52C|nr:energy transducer TonB [Sphingomonas sp. BK235]TCP34029.1 protein TonB [Sphingomonas sp. BK235]